MTIDALRRSAFPSRRLTKTLLIMKLTVIMLVLSLPIFAKGRAQERVTLSEKNASLEVVLKEIQKQTGYQYFFQDKWKAIAKKIDISVSNAALDDVLSICFKDQPFTYTLINKIIVVQEKQLGKVQEDNDRHGEIPTTLGGKVRSETGAPLAGATVTLEGTKKGGITNNNGEFLLQDVKPGKYTLEVSFVGYEIYKEDIVVTGHTTNIFAVLKQAINSLDEAQVIAYGEVSKRLQTGNVTTVKAEDIEKQPVSNPMLALEGRVPGLFITQSNGLPGSGVTVRVQGQNSILSGNDPLYVVDGVPYPSQMLSTVSGGPLGSSGGAVFGGVAPGGGNPLSYINPADIESIEVLKDADATAIYGSRAANGAILITTKKGKAGQTKVDINLQQGWGKEARRLKLLNTQQYLQMRNEALKNDGLMPDSTSDFDLTAWDPTRYTDWQKVLIGGTAQYNTINTSISGGTIGTQYLIGGTYHRETTVFPGDFADQKGSLHFNINNVSANQKFRIQLSGNYLVDNNQLPQSDQTSVAISLAPNSPALHNMDGSLNWAPTSSGASTFRNPLAYIYNSYQNRTTNLFSNAVLSYHILTGLEIRSSFGYTNLQTNEFFAFPLIANRPELRPNTTRSAEYTNSMAHSWLIEPQVNYKKTIGEGKLEALVGTTVQQNNSNGEHLVGIGYNSDDVLADIHSAASVTVNSTTASVYKYNALFGRVNYNWKDKYIINLTARRDGSSRFGAQNQFHNFASAGGAWIVSQEGFIKENIAFISFGKLRASYGTTGNDQIGEYQFMNLYNPTSADVPYQNTTGIAPNSLLNPYLQWEETQKMQFGLDLGFSHDRILLTANYVHNRSSNQLLQYALPFITGFTAITQNFPATVQNTAWEFMLNTTNVKSKNFVWSSYFNLTIPQNKLVAFPNLASSTYSTSLIIGQPISIIRAFHFLGADPTTGVYQFASKTDPFNPVFPDDATVLIKMTPKFYGGLQNSFKYKGLQLDILFQFVKQTGINNLFNFNPVPGQFSSGYSNQPTTVLNRWQKPGDKSSVQRYNSDGSLFISEYYAQSSDAGYSDASYIRLKNLSLSYALPMKSRQQPLLRNCIVYVQGQNLLTITRYLGLDPENQNASSLPPLRILMVGLRVGL
jgi:TonB-linked SusC/RagA family outer membrane protein